MRTASSKILSSRIITCRTADRRSRTTSRRFVWAMRLRGFATVELVYSSQLLVWHEVFTFKVGHVFIWFWWATGGASRCGSQRTRDGYLQILQRHRASNTFTHGGDNSNGYEAAISCHVNLHWQRRTKDWGGGTFLTGVPAAHNFSSAFHVNYHTLHNITVYHMTIQTGNKIEVYRY